MAASASTSATTPVNTNEIIEEDASELQFPKDFITADPRIEILAILRHYFKLGLKATEAARRIREVEGNEAISDRTAQNWFKRFKGGDISLEIKPKSGRPSVVNYDALKRKVEENPNTSTRKLSEELGSSKDTICRALHKLKKTHTSSPNVPNELS